MNNLPYDVGSELSVVQAIPPQVVAVANTGVAINGPAIDRLVQGSLAMSAKIDLQIGAGTSSPSAVSATGKIQRSADGSTGWTDYKPDGVTTAASGTGNSGVNSDSNFSVNLRMCDRWFRVVMTPNLTGAGSSIGVGATAALGGFANTPITTPAS